MDLRFTPEENAFRQEVRSFIKENLPDHIRKKAAEGIRYVKDDIVTWQRILNKKGWAVPHWPKEYGGTGWSPVQLSSSRKSYSRPRPRAAAVRHHDGRPADHRVRTDEQKEKYLPRIRATTGGARASPSPARAPTSLRSRPARSATATTTSSTARRPGRPRTIRRLDLRPSRAPTAAKQQEGITHSLST